MKKHGIQVKRLADWLRKNAFTKREEGIFEKILIRQIVNKKLGDEIALKDVPARPSEEFPESMALDIVRDLDTEAEQLGGMQQYACLAFFSEDREKHLNRLVVSIAGAEKEADGELVTEGADAKGLTAMAMRHQEASARINSGVMGQMFETLRKTNDRLMEMNEKLIDSRYQLLEQMSELMDGKLARDIEMQKEKAKTDAMVRGIATMEQLAPVIFNRVAGQKIFPEPQAGLNQLGSIFFRSLSEDQIKAFAATLKPEQYAQFAAIGDALTDASNPPPAPQPTPPNGTKQ